MCSLYSVLEIPDQKHGKLWQNIQYGSNLEQRLENAFENELFTDAEIMIRNCIFKAHKCILAFYSKTFQKIFFESKEASAVCAMNDVSAEGFKILLRTMYLATVPSTCSRVNIILAYHAALKLDITSLKEELLNTLVLRFLKPPKIMKNFWTIMEIAHSLKLLEIEEALLTFAEETSGNILKHDMILTAKKETMILVLDKLNVPDGIKLKTIATWYEGNKSKLPAKETSMTDILSCIKFQNLTPLEFYSTVSKHDNMIDMKDAFNILMHLVEPTACSLPSWCKAENIKSDKTHTSHRDVTTKELPEMTQNTRSLRDCFVKMFEEDTFVDVHLYDNAKSVSCKAHSLILAVGSPVFANMLYGPSANKVITTVANQHDLKIMVRSFYGFDEEIPHDSWASILKTFDTASKYGCENLQKSCEDALKSALLTPEIFWMLMDNVVNLHHISINTNSLIKYGKLHTRKILNNDKFFNASKSSLIQILQCNYLNITEYDILKSVSEWLEKNSKEFSTNESKIDILKHIRFESLNEEEFYSFLKRYNKILSQKDALEIFSRLFYKSENSLPDWCYTGSLRGLYYIHNKKIGTPHVIEESKVSDCKMAFTAHYSAKLLKGEKNCEIQYLELLWKVKSWSKDTNLNQNCSITIIFRSNNEMLRFDGIELQKYQRLMVPVFIMMKEDNPEVLFDIDIYLSSSRTLFFLKQHILELENVMITGSSSIYCICDAIVDGKTSENFIVPSHLLKRFPKEATPTEKWCSEM